MVASFVKGNAPQSNGWPNTFRFAHAAWTADANNQLTPRAATLHHDRFF